MPAKTFYLKDVAVNGFGSLSETNPGATTTATGWQVAKTASANFNKMQYGTEKTTGFSTTDGMATASVPASGDSWRSENPISGIFASANWTLTFAVRAVTAASSQAGAVKVRIWRSVNADGSSATQITSALLTGTTSSALSTTADVTSTVTFTPSGTITLNNEYLFVQCEWQITTASGSNSGDVDFRAGSSTVVTSNFTPFSSATLAGAGQLIIPQTQPPPCNLLLHFDGADGSTTFTDSSGTGKTISAQGGAKISTANSKFGGSSYAGAATGDGLYVTSNPDFSFGTGDFTVDGWFRFNSINTYTILDGRGLGADGNYIGGGLNNAGDLRWGGPGTAFGTATGLISDSNWHHIAFVRASGVFTFYLDGTAVSGGGSDTGSYTCGTGSGGVGLFNNPAALNAGLVGNVDEFRVIKGLAVWTGNFTPPTGPYTSSAGLLYVVASPQVSLVGAGALTARATVISRAQATLAGAGTLTATATPPAVNIWQGSATLTGAGQLTAAPAVSPPSVLLLHMNGANGSTTFTDSSGTGKTVAASGNAQISTAQSQFGGSSGAFDGVGDGLYLANSADFNFALGVDFTIDFWMKLNNFATTYTLLDGRGLGSDGNYVGGGFNNAGDLRWSGVGGGASQTAAGAIADTNWHHIAFVRSSNIVTIYVDGVNKNSGTITADTGNYTCGSGPNGLGLFFNPTNTSASLNGYVQEFRILNGLAAWTSNFTPPAAPYFPSNGQVFVAAAARANLIGAGALTIDTDLLARASATLTGAGTLTANAFVIRQASAILNGLGALTVSARLIEQTSVSLTGTGALTVDATVIHGATVWQGSATLTGSGALFADTDMLAAASATLSGSGALTANAFVARSASAVLNGAGALSIDARAARLAGASLAGAGALTLDTDQIAQASATLNGAGTLTASATGVAGGATWQGSATLIGAGGLSVTASLIEQTSASLNGAGALTVTTSIAELASAVLAGSGALLIDARVVRPASSILTGTGNLAANANVIAQTSASFAGAGALSIDARVARPASASLIATGGMTVSAQLIAQASANLTGSGFLYVDASAANVKLASASLAGAGALTVNAIVIASAAANLQGVGALSVSAQLIEKTSATLVGAGALSIDARRQTPAAATLAGAGALTVPANLFAQASAILAGSGGIAVSGQLIAYATVNLAGAGQLNVTAGGFATWQGSATLVGAGALTVNSYVARAAATTFSAAGALTASPTLIARASANLSGAGQITVDARPGGVVTATLIGAGALTANASVARAASASLIGSGSLSALPYVQANVSITLAGSGALTASARLLAFARAQLSGAGALTAAAGKIGIVIVPQANLALSSTAPTVARTTRRNISPPPANLVLSPTGAKLGFNWKISPRTRDLGLSTLPPQLVPGVYEYPPAGNLVLTTTAPILSFARIRHWQRRTDLHGTVDHETPLTGTVGKKQALIGTVASNAKLTGTTGKQVGLKGSVQRNSLLKAG